MTIIRKHLNTNLWERWRWQWTWAIVAMLLCKYNMIVVVAGNIVAVYSISLCIKCFSSASSVILFCPIYSRCSWAFSHIIIVNVKSDLLQICLLIYGCWRPLVSNRLGFNRVAFNGWRETWIDTTEEPGNSALVWEFLTRHRYP